MAIMIHHGTMAWTMGQPHTKSEKLTWNTMAVIAAINCVCNEQIDVFQRLTVTAMIRQIFQPPGAIAKCDEGTHLEDNGSE